MSITNSIRTINGTVPVDVIGIIGAHLYHNEFNTALTPLLDTLNPKAIESEDNTILRVRKKREECMLSLASYPEKSSWMGELLERCYSFITMSNQQHEQLDIPAAIILQSPHDPNDSFCEPQLLSQIEELAKTHYLFLREMRPGEHLGQIIQDSVRQVGQHPVKVLIVRAHGDQNALALTKDSSYTTDDVQAEDYTSLDAKASLIFQSCHVGSGLAKKIAEVQSRPVFAPIAACIPAHVLSYCENHGYEMLAFSEVAVMISRKIQKQNGTVQEALPCSATDNHITAAKKLFVDQCLRFIQEKNPIAQFTLAKLYEIGSGVDQSLQQAFFWYEEAANQCYAPAQFQLALMHEKNSTLSSLEKAVFWCKKAVNQGHIQAHFRLARLQLSLKAAIKQSTLCSFNLAVWYHEGKKIKQDLRAAAFHYQRAADNGHVEAQYRLAVFYEKGQGLKPSLEKAIFWCKKAADQGHLLALELLQKLTTA